MVRLITMNQARTQLDTQFFENYLESFLNLQAFQELALYQRRFRLSYKIVVH